jgi:hypothetical protein
MLVMGAIMGADVRICSPRDLWPPDEVRQIADEHTIKAALVATLGAG